LLPAVAGTDNGCNATCAESVVTKNIVFVLHGIGQYTDGWIDMESCAVPALKKAARSYSFFEGKSLDSFVEFVPILYDDVFERILKHWADLGEGLSSSIPLMPKFAKQVNDLMKQADEDRWSLKSGADVALYWGFRLFQQRVVLRVLAQISTRVADTIGATSLMPEYHVLAHSMGTAVAHDALHHLGTESWLAQLRKAPLDDPDGDAARVDRAEYLDGHSRFAEIRNNPFDPRTFKFSSITMLSNVSGLIHPSANPYESIVRPGSATDHGAYATNYFNVNHKFDPIALLGNFRMPAGWAFANGLDLQLDHLVGNVEQIHDAAHYISHPEVHLRLLTQYVDSYAPTADDVSQAAAFQNKNGIKNQAAGAAKSFLKGEVGPLGELVSKLKILAKLAEE
jgi:hypothetical protein